VERCGEGEDPVPAVAAPLSRAKEVLRVLSRMGLRDARHRPVKRGGLLYIPVTDRELAAEAGFETAVVCAERSLRGATFKGLLAERREVPPEVLARIPGSFDIVGDIALIELEPDVAERYGSAVAKAIMELHPRVRAVYARGPTVGVERVRVLRHIGGEERTVTVHREYGISICVDIAHAYYNPSLAEEHRRIAELVRNGDRVLDMFAGVGPFALHIAKLRSATVIAIDINPYAIACLRRSLELNRLRGDVHPLEGDSRLADSMLRRVFSHVIMNLPHSSLEFLPVALRLLEPGGALHIYLVAGSAEEARRLVETRAGAAGWELRVVEVRRVLQYAPRRWIYRVSTCTA